MNRTRAVSVPGRDIALTVSLGGAAPGCEPEITGLFWFSDASGAFDAEAEAAYLLPEGGAGPTIAAAKLLGETCGADITWATSWTPDDVDGEAPGIWSDGADLIVYPQADTKTGALSVTAATSGITYGPILLTIIRYSCAVPIEWESASHEPLIEVDGGWYYDGEYQGCDGCIRCIVPKSGSSWAAGFRPTAVALTVESSESAAGGDIVFSIFTTQEDYNYQSSGMPITDPGTYQITFELTDGYVPFPGFGSASITNYSTGELGDITLLGLWLGYGDVDTRDRKFTITSIEFS